MIPRRLLVLLDAMRGFGAFAICLGLLMWVWYQHYSFFRRYGLQDAYTVVLNGALLFVVMFYVYPLKFMFDSGFGQFHSLAGSGIPPMTLEQLAHASAMYGMGFVALFLMFALLYRHAYGQRHQLALTPLETFDVGAFAGQQIVSAAVGVIAGVRGSRRGGG